MLVHEEELQAATNESELMAMISDPHIVQHIESFEFEQRWYIIMELCEHSCLKTLLTYVKAHKVRYVHGIYSNDTNL